jgi:hypothetical protein
MIIYVQIVFSQFWDFWKQKKKLYWIVSLNKSYVKVYPVVMSTIDVWSTQENAYSIQVYFEIVQWFWARWLLYNIPIWSSVNAEVTV